MTALKPVVVTENAQVRQDLRALGLTEDVIANVARAAAAAKAEALEIDPSSTPGTLAYIKGVRTIRLELLPQGWRTSRAGNVESTVNDKMGLQLCFQNVDLACSPRSPQAISGKGAGSRRLIQRGQIELFDRTNPAATDAFGTVPTVWMVCVSTDAGRLRAEVSCPDAFEGDQFDGFSKRIFVVDEDLDASMPPIVTSDHVDDEEEHEVWIAKRS